MFSGKINLRYIFILMLSLGVLIVNQLHAEEKKNKHDSDTSYIETYSDKLGVYLYGISKYSNFSVKESGQKNDSIIQYKPNGNFNLGAGFSYKWLAFAAAFNFGFINNDAELKGKTNSLDLQMDIYAKRFFMDVNFQYYQGYYWSNPNLFIDNWNIKDSLVKRPDIATVVLGFSGIYVFNYDKFSFKAAYQYTERQKKGAGSLLLGYRISLYGISADSALIPEQLNEYYPDLVNVGGLGSLSFGGSLGYTHTFIIGKYFFVNGLLMTGLNSQILTVNDIYGEEIESASKFSANIMARLAFGINKPKVYYGLAFTHDSFIVNSTNESELNYTFGKFRLYYGRRFNISSE